MGTKHIMTMMNINDIMWSTKTIQNISRKMKYSLDRMTNIMMDEIHKNMTRKGTDSTTAKVIMITIDTKRMKWIMINIQNISQSIKCSVKKSINMIMDGLYRNITRKHSNLMTMKYIKIKINTFHTKSHQQWNRMLCVIKSIQL